MDEDLNLGWIERLIAVVRFLFFWGDGNRNMDGGLGGWKDICIYLYLKRGFNLFGSECSAFLA